MLVTIFSPVAPHLNLAHVDRGEGAAGGDGSDHEPRAGAKLAPGGWVAWRGPALCLVAPGDFRPGAS